jgi:hypothetical protein
MVITRRWAVFLMAAGVWSWVIWPRFAVAIAKDDRAFSGGTPTSFFWVHAILIVVSLAVGTMVGVLGIKAWRASTRTEEFVGAVSQPPKD